MENKQKLKITENSFLNEIERLMNRYSYSYDKAVDLVSRRFEIIKNQP